MKKITVGFIVGFVMSLAVQGFADEIHQFIAQKATFDVVVNGDKLDSDKPVVAIDGSTYLPLKDTGEALGVPVNWNEEKRRVEIGTMPENEVVEITPQATQTQEVTQVYEDENIKLELLGLRIPNKEEFPQIYSSTSDTIALQIRFTNKSNSIVSVNNKDFRGIYELKSPPENTDQFQYVANGIRSNKGNIFSHNIEDPGFWNIIELLSFKFAPLQPGESREGNIVFSAVRFNFEWIGLKYKGIELKKVIN